MFKSKKGAEFFFYWLVSPALFLSLKKKSSKNHSKKKTGNVSHQNISTIRGATDVLPHCLQQCQTLRCLLGGIGRDSVQIFKEVFCPRVPCGAPGDLQGLAGGRQGQEVRGGGQDAAEWADSMMARCLERDVIPGRQYQKCKLSVMLNSGETNEIEVRVFTCVSVTVVGRRVPG